MRILITGATGLVGTELVSLLLQNGESIHYLTTSKNKISNESHYKGFYWNPEQGIIDENALIGVDAIVHLAGATVSRRWTNSYKQEIVASRVLSANLLYKTLKSNPHQVVQIVSASAIGLYPDSQNVLYNEDSKAAGSGFLARVVTKWESSVDKFRQLDIKVCKLRTGLVLSRKGGALPEMIKPVRWGISSPFGNGKQIQSWIHVDDLAAMYYFAVQKRLDGTFNAVTPNPVSNEVMTRQMAKALDRPLFMPNIPRLLMKFILGDMHELLFSSQNVSAGKIIDSGFTFKFEKIDKALENLLK